MSTETHKAHITFEKSLFDLGKVLAKSRRKKISSLLNDLLEKELIETGHLKAKKA